MTHFAPATGRNGTKFKHFFVLLNAGATIYVSFIYIGSFTLYLSRKSAIIKLRSLTTKKSNFLLRDPLCPTFPCCPTRVRALTSNRAWAVEFCNVISLQKTLNIVFHYSLEGVLSGKSEIVHTLWLRKNLLTGFLHF